MTGYVYFIKPVGLLGPIKIGHSVRPKERLGAMMQWSPIPLELVLTFDAPFSMERNIHECFADAHSHREWFHATPRLVAAITAMQSGVPVHEAVDLTHRLGSIRRLKLIDSERRKGTTQETMSW